MLETTNQTSKKEKASNRKLGALPLKAAISKMV